VLLLGFDQFEFIKTLRQHRQMVLYCTLLAQAQDNERDQIEQQMAGNPELQRLLGQLRETDETDIVEVSYSN
jgi:pre-mRNA-splicing helicase BRR2